MSQIITSEKKYHSIGCPDIVTWVMDFFFSVFSGPEREIPQVIYALLFILLFIMFALNMIDLFRENLVIYKIFKSEKENLKRRAKQDIFKRQKFALQVDDLMESRNQYVKKICRKHLLRMGFIIILVIIMSWRNPQNAAACIDKAKGWFRTEETTKQNDNTDDKDEEEPATKKYVADDAEENNSIEKPRGYRFILDRPNEKFKIDPELENQVFFYINGTEAMLEQAVIEYMDEIVYAQKENANLFEIVNQNDCNFFNYTSLEDQFKEKVNLYETIKDYQNWLELAPHSSEMEIYINGREELNIAVDENGNSGNYKIWWKLANDYQYYALEYEKQTDNAGAVLYFYSKSIQCCMKALQYEMDGEEYNRIFDYLTMRYHDIFSDQCIISERYKKCAEKIYTVLRNHMDLFYK